MRSPLTLESDIIAGLATPPGSSGVAVIRLSGPGLPELLLPLLRHPHGKPLSPAWFQPRLLHRLDLFDPVADTLLDQALVVYFPAPHSFTGEPQMEIQCHGAPVVVARLLALLTAVGIRMARPGEFSRRAYQHGKLDLTQAEALMALIHASTLRAAREAARQLQGSLATAVGAVREGLLDLLVQVEADLDFADEEIDPATDTLLQHRLTAILTRLATLTQGAALGQHWQDGLDWVIAGQPNVGKSSLYNRLVGRDKAIVTAIPGTTRDLNEHRLEWQGIPVLLVDTAGLRSTEELVEQEGIRRAQERIAQADGVLLLYDAQAGLAVSEQQLAQKLGSERVILVANKGDLCPASGPLALPNDLAGYCSVVISCLTGEGLDRLAEVMHTHFLSQPGAEEGSILLLARQREAILRTEVAVQEAEMLVNRGAPKEILAMVLRSALEAVGELAGETCHAQLLDRIFAQFCIGK
ncbi:MAG: tRNA uridine-5-carboxymethylaminomethyl(34) synthesis GTPase MnmE [Magnetococcales bacterium]|nr:tRNA uridine-5-carboxymethylaminomethyl(34) synthesis GTPase MnmE [Magnetococcales bacterium]